MLANNKKGLDMPPPIPDLLQVSVNVVRLRGDKKMTQITGGLSIELPSNFKQAFDNLNPGALVEEVKGTAKSWLQSELTKSESRN